MRAQWLVVAIAACMLAACSRQEAGWREAARADSIAAYEAYLSQYPAGAHGAEARARILSLREEQDWARAERLRTPESWQRYLADWPDGRHAAEAQSRLARYVPTHAAMGGDWTVQLGAFSNESAARTARERHAREHAGDLAGLPLVVLAPRSDPADVWRLRTGPLTEAAARDLCARLRGRDVDCVPLVN
ncbi:MAG TPA: SPOR domain-containing protein [Steroidobacteraceae bacterium]|nr:SPOR domain-containing protein [Steroidobacteraceae bacterium]